MLQPSEDESLQKIKAAVPRGKGPRGKAARGRTAARDHNSARTVGHGHCHILVGQTPAAIRKSVCVCLCVCVCVCVCIYTRVHACVCVLQSV